ncbi:unnamed protein product [Ambrosiozyma monospora]|uniref:Unnamed protein product n=1 Tax=Ambrosiozyma monospora TaxID=43982 RepID=A0ACB5TAP5_AMBMO|nr:unnamed protein product [Ambrosiozyma monospora]
MLSFIDQTIAIWFMKATGIPNNVDTPENATSITMMNESKDEETSMLSPVPVTPLVPVIISSSVPSYVTITPASMPDTKTSDISVTCTGFSSIDIDSSCSSVFRSGTTCITTGTTSKVALKDAGTSVGVTPLDLASTTSGLTSVNNIPATDLVSGTTFFNIFPSFVIRAIPEKLNVFGTKMLRGVYNKSQYTTIKLKELVINCMTSISIPVSLPSSVFDGNSNLHPKIISSSIVPKLKVIGTKMLRDVYIMSQYTTIKLKGMISRYISTPMSLPYPVSDGNLQLHDTIISSAVAPCTTSLDSIHNSNSVLNSPSVSEHDSSSYDAPINSSSSTDTTANIFPNLAKDHISTYTSSASVSVTDDICFQNQMDFKSFEREFGKIFIGSTAPTPFDEITTPVDILSVLEVDLLMSFEVSFDSVSGSCFQNTDNVPYAGLKMKFDEYGQQFGRIFLASVVKDEEKKEVSIPVWKYSRYDHPMGQIYLT